MKDINGQYDRITDILRSQTVKEPDYMDYQTLALGNMTDPTNFVNQAFNLKKERAAAPLQKEMDILKIFEAKKAAGDAQSKALDDRISMFTGDDPDGKAMFLQALHEDPDDIDPSNSYQVMSKLAGIAKQRGYVSPSLAMDKAIKQAELNKLNADAARASKGEDAPANVREYEYFTGLPPEAQKQYLDLRRPSSQKTPLEYSGVQKEFVEAGERVGQADRAINDLNSALLLNKKARGGTFAGVTQAGGRVVGSLTSPSNETVNTTEFDNIVRTQALESLKLTFGGNPTEGERQILIDLQASIDKTPKEREAILNRALEKVKDRKMRDMDFQSRASEGTLFDSPALNSLNPSSGTPEGWIIEEID